MIESSKKLRVSSAKRNTMFSCYLTLFTFTATFNLVVSSKPEIYQRSLLQNPGKGVNFYGKIQSNPVVSESRAENAYDNLMQEDCAIASKDSSCVKDSLYHYPGIVCQIENPVPCNYSYPYRTYDGTCNNPLVSTFGIANQCYERFLPPYYEGFGGFRRSVKGGPLPEPRDLSLKIFQDHHRPAMNVTFQFVTFGEYSSLDFLMSVQPPMDCCSEKNAKKPNCKPISIRSDDPFYSQFNKTCINFRRTVQCSCNTPNRAQTNGATAFFDDSQLYGVKEEDVRNARTLDGTGQLKHDITKVGCLLPPGKNPADPFCPKGEDKICFKGPDPRINHHAIVMSHFTMFMREHNRIATALKEINPHWGEEKLFQEARKILNAEHQCIFFKDYLPIVLSPRIVKEFGLTVPEGESGMQYNSSVIPGTWNEFAISSFRLHSMVRKDLGSLNLQFRQTFSNPQLLREGHLTEIIKGIRHVPGEQYDRYMISDLTNYLYEKPGVPYGKDLASLNIQRGRDHGLAPYIEVVKFCSDGTILISSFDDLYKLGLMTKDNADLLKKVYAAVEDIDVWVGMNLEEHMPGSVLGPSSACINAKQFYFIQKGDRFYFDLVGPNAPFTTEQRKALKQCSWSRFLCDNTHVSKITKNPFILPSDQNTEVSCNEIPKIDLTLWKDNGNTAGMS